MNLADVITFICFSATAIFQVHFSDGTQLPIHLNIIQAFVILLTYSTMIQNSQPILDYWFPPGTPPPQAFTIDTAEPVQILPDWLKLKMIRSPVDRLVDAALLDLTPDQIVLFVQNFGTPVNSMSKLLALLDRAVIEQFETVKLAILNKAYLAQLIEIQQARGAKNGHIAVQALELHGSIAADPPKREVIAVELLNIDFEATYARGGIDQKLPVSRTVEIEETLDIILRTPSLNKAQLRRFRKLMQQLIARNIAGKRLPPRLHTMYGTASGMQQFVATKVLAFLHRVSKGGHAAYFFQNLFQRSTICSLFRSLLAWTPDKADPAHMHMIMVMDQLVTVINPVANPVVLQILAGKRQIYVDTPKHVVAASEHHRDLMQLLNTAKLMELEKSGKKLLNDLSKQNSVHTVDVLTAALTSIDSIRSPAVTGDVQNDKIGLLVDWLADIDSELVVATERNQLDLLFNRSQRQFRFYMLSLLSHQASWATLHSTLNRLLNRFNETHDPSSVLHFIGALVQNPKLWQGRDKATPKHEQIEYVITMNGPQTQVFVDYVLGECLLDDEKLCSRVEILLKCADAERLNLKSLIAYVRQHSAGAEMKKKFLQQLYLNIPSMKFIVPDLADVYAANAKQLIGCQADIVSNYTLTAISSLSVAKDYQIMSIDMELIVRKLAASHPSLILRQLSVLASLLQGRAHMDIYVLRSGHHMALFNQVIGILELLQPQVFEEPYKDSLHQALECYFTLLRHHGHTKDAYPLMCRFMELLQAYTNKSASRALSFIEPYAELIQDLAANNRHIVPLQQLVQGVSLLKHKHTHDFFEPNTANVEEVQSEIGTPSTSAAASSTAAATSAASLKPEADSTGAAAVILAPFTKQNLTPQHWPQLIKHVMRRSGNEDILAAIQEIEAITAKRQGLLDPLFERLLELVQSPIGGIRHAAHTLLTRHLKSNPGNTAVNRATLVAYVQCLRDADPAIVASALDTLTEVVICLQEFASDILCVVFELGIQSKQNTFEHLRRTILALKTQHAC